MAEADSTSPGFDGPRVTAAATLLRARSEPQRDPLGNANDCRLQEKYAVMSFFEKYVLEIIFLLFIFPNNLLGTPTSDLYMRKACLYELGYNSTVCDHFKDNNTIQKEVQDISNYYSTMKNIVSTLPGAAVSLIAGQYMSRYGMKGPMLLALLGTILSSVLQWYTFYKMPLPLFYNVLAEIPSALTGGMIVLSTAVYSNITLTCPASKRKTRFLIVQFVTFVPLLIAMSLGGFLYEHFAMTELQLSVVLLYFVPFIALLMLYTNPERSESVRKDSWKEVLWHSIGWAVIRKSFSYIVKKRPHFARAQIYFMFVCLMIAIMGFSGTSELNYYYVNKIYKWEVIDFTTIGAVANALTILVAVPNMWFFSDVLKMSDPEMVAACFFSYSLKYGLLSIAKWSIYLYYAQIVAGLPFMVLNISVRSHLSRLLDSHEVPVVFALTSSSEHLAPIASDYVNMLLYRWSEESFPGLAFACQSGLFLVPAVLGLICAGWIRQYGYPNYDDILLGNSRQHTA